MTIQPIIDPSFSKTQFSPLLQTMLEIADNLPKTGLPTETEGTVQENTHLLPAVTLYNSHGILNKTNPNSLIAYA